MAFCPVFAAKTIRDYGIEDNGSPIAVADCRMKR
jgi:hypothetical protein